MMNYAADAQTKIGPDRLDRVQEVMLHRLYDKVSQWHTHTHGRSLSLCVRYFTVSPVSVCQMHMLQ